MSLSSVKSYLKQLKQPELVRLAKNKGANISEKMEKPDLIKILTPFVSQRDVTEMFRKPGETGLRGVLSGEHFERKVLTLFKRMGFSCHLDQHIKGSEFDIVGDKKEEGFWSTTTEWLLAECKNKPKVLLNDFMKFVGKFETFKRRHSEDKVLGFFVTSGVFDPSVKSAKRNHPEIQLKRIRA